MKNNQTSPELDLMHLKALVQELLDLDVLAGALNSKGRAKVRGLAFILKDLDSEELGQVRDRFDLTVRLSPRGFKTLAALKKIVEENRTLIEFASKDPLTKLYNYRYLRQQLAVEMERVKRTKRPCSLLMIDLDKFKLVNDKYGHETGNQVLKTAANIIKDCSRSMDMPTRYGGDEFAVIIPETEARQALRVAERIRKSFLTHPGLAEYQIGGSFGLATYHYFDRNDLATFIKHADQSMYRAKKEGGNRVVIWEADLTKEASTEVTPEERDALYRLDADF